MYDPYSDPNYEPGLKSKKSSRYEQAPTRDKDMNDTVKSVGRGEQALQSKLKESPKNFSK